MEFFDQRTEDLSQPRSSAVPNRRSGQGSVPNYYTISGSSVSPRLNRDTIDNAAYCWCCISASLLKQAQTNFPKTLLLNRVIDGEAYARKIPPLGRTVAFLERVVSCATQCHWNRRLDVLDFQRRPKSWVDHYGLRLRHLGSRSRICELILIDYTVAF